MHKHKPRKVMFALLFFAGSIIASTKYSYADVRIVKSDTAFIIDIFNTISKADAISISQRIAESGRGYTIVRLNSSGGDVDAAMQIGRIIRKNDLTVSVPRNANCYSSCALIFIAGVTRINLGTIGLHRPYFASAPLSVQEIQRQVPLMLQKLKTYVQEMGVTDNFYQQMVNTEPSAIKLYAGDNIAILVPQTDPIYDEILTSASARRYGISTAEMRKRDKEAERCFVKYTNDMRRAGDCGEAIRWGLSERVYKERAAINKGQCKLSDEELKTVRSTGRNEARDHPLVIKAETCLRNIMLGR